MTSDTMRAVRFDRYGDRDVLYLTDIPVPVPGPGDVLVRIRAAGINPGEVKIRTGALHDRYPATFPSGQGSDLAGTVVRVGGQVTDLRIGDDVLGYSWTRSSHATHAVVPASQVIHKPANLAWEVAGSLYVAGCTAIAAVEAVTPRPGETVAVSAAAGGVGAIVLQLLRLQNTATVGIGSPTSRARIESLGARFVPYGPGLTDRLADAVPSGIDAVIDLYGDEYVQAATDLGVPPDRIETVTAFALAAEIGAKTRGSVDGTSRANLARLAHLADAGEITIPVAGSYPIEQVREAFAELERGHTHGKIVLVP